MNIEELTEMTYREFINAVATARAKQRMKVRLTEEERYLLVHQTSIECVILDRDERTVYGVPKYKPVGLSDENYREPEMTRASWAAIGMVSEKMPSRSYGIC